MGGKVTDAMLKRICLPKVHWKCTLAQIPSKCPHKQAIQKWTDEVVENVRNARGLLLMGAYSTGKSGCAAICLKAAAVNGILGYWVRAYDLPGQVINAESFDEEYTVKQRADTVSLLVIDEVQIREKTAYTEDIVERLVRRRVDDGLCTILTTNHAASVLESRMKSLMAVLKEAVKPEIIKGVDWRPGK